ncbi:MAG: glutathione S-transferase N-terminal domain-containing protein, partial [Gammaproteobacteria bacterium]
MKLHGYWRSSAAWRVRIALEWKGLDVEHLPVHLLRDGGRQRAPGYRALNPQALVPTLVVGERPLTQSLAIVEWLDEQCPQPPQLPPGSRARARARELALAIA